MSVLAAIHSGAAERIVRVVLVEPIVLVEHRDAGSLDGRHVAECIPHYLKVVVHFTAASHEEALCDIPVTVAAAAGKLELFKQMNVLALHLSVTNQIEGSRQTCKSGADDVSRLLIDILRLFGMSE